MSMTKMDANNVLRSAWSEADGALKTVPASTTSFSIELDAEDGDSVQSRPVVSNLGLILEAHDASDDVIVGPLDVLNYKVVGISVDWSGVDAADGSLQVEGSLDDSIFHNEGSAITLASASGKAFVKVADNAYSVLQLSYAANSNTTGTINITAILKA